MDNGYCQSGKGLAVLEDCIMAKGHPATAGATALKGFVSPFDSTVVERLRNAGWSYRLSPQADELGIGGIDRTASSEALEAVARGEAGCAMSNDLFGNRRKEAAMLGLCYLHPTYGTVSRYGLVPCASSMDQIGVAAKDMRACAALLRIAAGPDQRDGAMLPALDQPADKRAAASPSQASPAAVSPTQASAAAASPTAASPAEARCTASAAEALRTASPEAKGPAPRASHGLRAYVPEAPAMRACADARAALEDIAARFPMQGDSCDPAGGGERCLGATGIFGDAEEPPRDGAGVRRLCFDDLGPAMYALACAEAFSNMSRYDGVKFGHRASGYRGLNDMYAKSRTEGFGPEARLAAIMGAMALSRKNYARIYEKAMRIRRMVKQALCFSSYDFIALPASLAERHAAPFAEARPYAGLSLYAASALAGLPSASFKHNGGCVLLIARQRDEACLLAAWEALRA